LATAFYAQVAEDPILRPLFPSTFTCAIEEFSAFLVQFLGGEAEATQRRWWLGLSESHHRFAIGPRERNAWLRAMSVTLENESLAEQVDAALDHAAHKSGLRYRRLSVPEEAARSIFLEPPLPACKQARLRKRRLIWTRQSRRSALRH